MLPCNLRSKGPLPAGPPTRCPASGSRSATGSTSPFVGPILPAPVMALPPIDVRAFHARAASAAMPRMYCPGLMPRSGCSCLRKNPDLRCSSCLVGLRAATCSRLPQVPGAVVGSRTQLAPASSFSVLEVGRVEPDAIGYSPMRNPIFRFCHRSLTCSCSRWCCNTRGD